MTTPVMITPVELAEQMGKDQHVFYEWASRKVDPLPLRYARGTRSYGSIMVSEWEEWWQRNSVHYQEREM